MLRSFLRVGALGAVLTSGAACHLLLEGQDLGGSGAGSSGDGGQGGRGTSTGMPTSTTNTGTADQASSMSSGPSTADGGCILGLGYDDGIDPADACNVGPVTASVCTDGCQPLDPGVYRYNFRVPCAHAEWCEEAVTLANAGVDGEREGRLRIDSGQLTGFWLQNETAPMISFPPYLFRTIAADLDFVFATRIASLSVTGGTYNVAGIILRDPADAYDPEGMNEHWVKLEYGRRGGGGEDYPGFGVLLGQGVQDGAAQIGGDPAEHVMPEATAPEEDVGLAVCRIDGAFEFYAQRDPSGPWVQVALEAQAVIEPFASANLQVGLTAGALYGSENSAAFFEWATFVVEDELTACGCLDYINEADGC
ncbi:MAG: hypothetical protein HOV80_00670 [Polyangiaceae bacterium]|nr:hypothetical protein [Polyangiaceae bacterium]